MIGASDAIVTPERAPFRQDRAPWGFVEIAAVLGVVMVALVAIFTVLAFLLRALGVDSGNVESDIVGGPVELGGQIVLDLIAVGVAAGFSLGKFHLPAAAWGLVRTRRFNVGLVAATVAGSYLTLALYGILVTILRLDALLPKSNAPTGLLEHRAVVPFTVFFIVVVAPICEEMFFRGFIFHGLWSRLGLWPAAALSGFFFGAIHFSGASTLGIVLPFTVIGMLFALLVRRTGSLWNSILAHMLFNGISISATLVAGAAVLR